MKIIEIRKIEDCFDGSFIRELLLDSEITEELIHHLGEAGKLQYHKDFARPFFRVDVGTQYSIKGVEGNRTLRAVLKGELLELLDVLHKQIEQYSERLSGSKCS